MPKLILGWLAVAACALGAAPATAVDPPGRVTGVGGVFFRSRNPQALMEWYRDVLGVAVAPWGGIAFATDLPGHPPVVTLNALRPTSRYFDPSPREFMLDLAVDDLDAFLVRLKAKGVVPRARDDSDPSGRFAWIVDPDGTKIELWQPSPPAQ